jgi:succinyl-CoA synthetase alpha subunit
MALVSVAGRFAGTVAMECLRSGLHVMLFSDNVPVEEEIALKKYADSQGLLVMGPDCGSAIINGVPLGFANSVRRGDIGIVAAAGTGLQEVSTIVSNYGAGISQAIGTGGRDVKKEIGGASFLRSLDALAEDTDTRVIVLVSKPPYPDVLMNIRSKACRIAKPIVSVFLGSEEASMKECGLHSCSTLEEAAILAVALSKGEAPDEALAGLKMRDQRLGQIASDEAGEKRKGQHYVRGLFCGGTLAAEAQVILGPMIGDICSNVPLLPGCRLGNSLESVANTVVDFGEDEFTVGRPHPMIDYSLRNRRIVKEARDPETTVILLDVVIGYGSNPRPAEDLIPALTTARAIALSANRRLWIVCSVTGTDQDPQCRAEVVRALEESGAIVGESNAAACRLAGLLVKSLQTGS